MTSNLIDRCRKLGVLVTSCDLQWLRALRFGIAAGVEHEQVLRNLDKILTVVDIGANRGQFALAVRHYLPDASVISFEPLPEPAEKFRRVFSGDNQVRLYQAAIGPKAIERKMHVSAADDSSSLLPIGRAQKELFPGTEESHLERVKIAPLSADISDDKIIGPALLKIDVQGYELEVLRGCESLLDQFSSVYVECSFVELYEGQALAHEVIDWLHERNFQLARIGQLTFDKTGMSVQGDFLFLRHER